MNNKNTFANRARALFQKSSRPGMVFFVVAMVASAAIIFLGPLKFLKYSMILVGSGEASKYNSVIFHDFDANGDTERIQLHNDSRLPTSVVTIMTVDGAYIDQYPFNNPFYGGTENLFFGDVNNDNVDECVVFSKSEDTLYLSILNINPPGWLVREKPLLAAWEGNPYHIWDIGSINCQFLDADNDGYREVLFSLKSGYSLHPRGVYLYDLKSDSVIRKFEVDAAIENDLFLVDLNDDGKEEIIVATVANGNIKNSTNYSDFKCWLFILNRNLQPLIPPISFGEYPSNLFCAPVRQDGRPFFLVMYNYGGNKYLPGFLYLIDGNGKEVRKKAFRFPLNTRPFVLRGDEFYSIYVGDYGVTVSKMDLNFNTIKELGREFPSPRLLKIDDFLGNGQQQLLISTAKGLHLFSSDFTELACYPLVDYINMVTLRRQGSNKPVELNIFGTKSTNIFHIEKNLLSVFAPPVWWLLLTLGLYVCLAAGNAIHSRGYIVFRYLKESLGESSAGVLILDYNRCVIHSNSKARRLLGVEDKHHLKHYLSPGKEQQSEFAKIILTSIETDMETEMPIAFHDGKEYFNGSILVKPFKSSWGFLYGHLVKIGDHSQEIISDRLQIWSRMIERIAHDIKKPLASIILNLDTVRIDLNKSNFPEKPGIEEDLDSIQVELEWIKNQTKLFQIFANLDDPIFEAVQLTELIAEAILPFQLYLNSGLTIRTVIDQDSELIWADPRLMLLLFRYVLENAIDATEGAGIIDIRSSMAQDMLKESQYFADIEVADNGAGIPAELLSSVFEPHISSKGEGRGMGLVFAKKFVTAQNGQIQIYSNKPKGTVVSFTIPLFQKSD